MLSTILMILPSKFKWRKQITFWSLNLSAQQLSQISKHVIISSTSIKGTFHISLTVEGQCIFTLAPKKEKKEKKGKLEKNNFFPLPYDGKRLIFLSLSFYVWNVFYVHR
jgi:hypothetical protein